MIRINMNPGEEIAVGESVIAFFGKENGRSIFKISPRSGAPPRFRRAGPEDRLELDEASIVVEPRSGRSTRVSIDAPPAVPVRRPPRTCRMTTVRV